MIKASEKTAIPQSSDLGPQSSGLRPSGRPRNKATETVRAYAASVGAFTRAKAREATGLKRQDVDTAIDTLLRGKRLKHTGRASYEWIPEKRPVRLAPLEERIWHAMRINPSWSAADIAVQAGTTVSYVYKRLRAYRAAGFIKRHGQKSVPQGSVRIWKLTVEASAKLDVPRVEEYSPDPLIIATVRLNRLVCSGLIHFVDERREAFRLCNTILAALSHHEEAAQPSALSPQSSSD